MAFWEAMSPSEQDTFETEAMIDLAMSNPDTGDLMVALCIFALAWKNGWLH
jgi:hypothetical protein